MTENWADARFEASNLELWRGERRLFTRLEFATGSGELLHITGANGTGKTSLLRVICGLTLPETGEVRWRGRPVGRQRSDFHAELTYVGHRESLKADLSAVENLSFELGLRRDLADAEMQHALDVVGLSRATHVPVRSLSAGQKRRVALARCLLTRAPLWILDEPYTNLDVAGRELVDQLMTQHLETGGQVLLVAHQSHGVQRPGTRTLEMA
mgnify:CR=1 FL=1